MASSLTPSLAPATTATSYTLPPTGLSEPTRIEPANALPSGNQPSFAYPPLYNFPPFYTLQPNTTTRQAQLQAWSGLIQSYCKYHRTWRLSLVDAIDTPLFRNDALNRRLSLADAQTVLDWMANKDAGGGGGRAEWISTKDKSLAWIYWRRPEEWAELIAGWVDDTGQKNTVLTFYELMEGEMTTSQEFHGMDPDLFQKSLNLLVKRGRAQVFGSEDQQGVKFF
ncbi:putative ESCRT-II complex component [Xylona heveae TC161]|uniref:Vacuolar protein-sorting-associated protein 25 n=1 Tax=Xylona heveae (strain CBS 132557 / TC161) TaxID=1328760 RepID=A0A165JLF0_XYLHT|nr:putative ESCRT-II complex component [Xylona heveae TC161]KZF26386.1 putative ESCRT-II complex component [Xylona heveae TC161]